MCRPFGQRESLLVCLLSFRSNAVQRLTFVLRRAEHSTRKPSFCNLFIPGTYQLDGLSLLKLILPRFPESKERAFWESAARVLQSNPHHPLSQVNKEQSMKLESLDDLLIHELKDLLSAESNS